MTKKTCSACKRRLPRDAFPDTQELGYVREGMGDGKHDECRECVGAAAIGFWCPTKRLPRTGSA
jgi:hypothetical protein